MKQTYICLDCGHTFTSDHQRMDGKCCPDCGGRMTACTIDIDLAKVKAQTIIPKYAKGCLNANGVMPGCECSRECIRPSAASSTQLPTYSITINTEAVKDFNDIIKEVSKQQSRQSIVMGR